MTHHIGNLGPSERVISGILGVALSVLGLFGRGVLLRTAGTATGLLLLARAASGHCAMKAAVTGQSSLREGMKDEWHAMRDSARSVRKQLRQRGEQPTESRSPSEAVDESVRQSFPASDPPASRLPDVTPVNAAAKWEAARNAGLTL